MHRALALGFVIVFAGCALKGDVRRVEAKVDSLRVSAARAEAARTAEMEALERLLLDIDSATAAALSAQQLAVTSMRADLSGELLTIRQQLVQIQELTGQSQQRLTELRRGLDQTREGAVRDSLGVDDAEAGAMFDASLRQLRRGSLETARAGFQQFLTTFPDNERVPDALFYVASTFRQENPDSAAVYLLRVVEDHATSDRAPEALFDLGAAAERRGDEEAAQRYFDRLIEEYPNSPEANLARSRRQG